MTDSKMLRDEITNNRWTVTALANVLNISRPTMYAKISNRSEFRASEIETLSKLLHLTKEKRDRIFFGVKK